MRRPWYIDEPLLPENENLEYAHGTVMVIAWILLGSTGILFARYGRLLRIDKKRKLLGEVIWFQAHRIIQCLVTVCTLLGFFLILVKEKGQWVSVDKDGRRIFAHSVLGGIIVCCALLQPWIALFHCRTDSSFRPIFNWIHRGFGYLSFVLSIPTIFLQAVEPKTLPRHRGGLIAILSLWSSWVVIVVILFEVVEYSARAKSSTEIYHVGRNQPLNSNLSSRRRTNSEPDTKSQSLNNVRIFLFLLHITVAVSLTIPLIVLIWQQT